jgi:hypothetical protein
MYLSVAVTLLYGFLMRIGGKSRWDTSLSNKKKKNTYIRSAEMVRKIMGSPGDAAVRLLGFIKRVMWKLDG